MQRRFDRSRPAGGGGSCEEVDPPGAGLLIGVKRSRPAGGGSFDWCEKVKTRRGAGLSIGVKRSRPAGGGSFLLV